MLLSQTKEFGPDALPRGDAADGHRRAVLLVVDPMAGEAEHHGPSHKEPIAAKNTSPPSIALA